MTDALLPVVHLAVTAAYAGFQWTVRGLVYPQFEQAPAAAFRAYERRHQQRISRVVGPLFAGQLVTTTWLLVARPSGAVLVGAACLAVVLLRVDTLRAVAATAGTAAAVRVLVPLA